MHSNMTPGCCFELAWDLADIVIVDGLLEFHVRNWPHVNYTSPFHLVGVDLHDRFHEIRILCIDARVNNIAALLRYFVVVFERVRIFHGLELRNDVSGLNHNHVRFSIAWKGVTVKFSLQAHWIYHTTVWHNSSNDNFCVTNVGVEGNLRYTNVSALGRRFLCFLAADEGVHIMHSRCVLEGEIVW